MVDRVIGSRQVNEDSTGDQALLIAIFNIDGLGHKPLKSGQAFFRTMIKTIKHIGHKTSISVGRLDAAQNVQLSRRET